ncbi:uncharacterized protein LOC134699485 isoform X2 [Mytilus trossulus]|uniref:uncharacterized protein LOC134699485 isoform X2 n=1 Tax=Mytilus trossulus TaxID=6551 RepID=UPI0030052ACD
MNPNIYSVRPGYGQGVFMPGFNPSSMQQPPPGSGRFVYQSPQAMPFQFQGQSMQYQQQLNTQYQQPTSTQFQQQTSSQFQQQTSTQFQQPMNTQFQTPIMSGAGYQRSSPLQPGQIIKPNCPPVSQQLRSPVMVVSSQARTLPEFRPVSPMSQLVGLQQRMTSPLNRSLTSPLDTSLSSPDTGQIDQSTKAQTPEEIFKAKASHYGINIVTKSDKINQTTAKIFRKVEEEKNRKEMAEDPNTQTFMQKASKYGIKIENPKKRMHSESESSETSSVVDMKTSNRSSKVGLGDSLGKGDYNQNFPVLSADRWKKTWCSKEKMNLELGSSNEKIAVDSEVNGIENSHILYELESKKKSNYEQMLTALRRTNYAPDVGDYDDLSTPELQSPRDAAAPEDWEHFKDGIIKTPVVETTRRLSQDTDSLYMSDTPQDEDGKDRTVTEDEKLFEIANKLVQKAIASALQELRAEDTIDRVRERRRKKAMDSLTSSGSDQLERFGVNYASESSGSRSQTPQSDLEGYLAASIPVTEHEQNKQCASSHFEINATDSWSCIDDSENSDDKRPLHIELKNVENETIELNPQSPEFKPSGFKYANNLQQPGSSTSLKADVPEFIPSVIPMYVPKTGHSKSNVNIEQNLYQESIDFKDYYKLEYSTGQSTETQTDSAEVNDAMTNTKHSKVCDKSVETKTCDVREIVVNTVESMFDQQSVFFIDENTDEVDHGHLDVCVQTDENENSLKQKLIEAQRELLKTRYYVCYQQLEQEIQHIRSSKYQIYSVFSHLGDRSKVADVVETRILYIKGEIQRLKNKLAQFEKVLDEKILFEQVPDFGVTLDMDSMISSVVKTDSKEVQTEKMLSKESPSINEHQTRFLSEAIKKLLHKLDGSDEATKYLMTVFKDMLSTMKLLSDCVQEHTAIGKDNMLETLNVMKEVVREVSSTVRKAESEIKNLNSSSHTTLVTEALKDSNAVNTLPENSVEILEDKGVSRDNSEERKENIDVKDKAKSKKGKKSKKKKLEKESTESNIVIEGKTDQSIEKFYNGEISSERTPASVKLSGTLVKASASLEKLEANLKLDEKLEFDEENTLLKEQNESEMSVKPSSGEVKTVKHEIKLSTVKTDNEISTVKNNGIASTVENSDNTVKNENLDKAIAQSTDIKGSLEDIDDDELDFDVEMSKSYHSASSEYVSAASQQTSQCHTPVLLSASEENQFFISNKSSSQESVEKQSEQLTDNDSTSTMNSSSAQQETSAIIDSSHKNNEQLMEGESQVPYLNTNVIGVSTSANATIIPQEESAMSTLCQSHLESNVQPDLSCQNQSGLLSQVTNNSLYEAVVQQLKQVYPHLASNPVMLNMIALQQTSVLHNYLGKSDGPGMANQMQAFGMETAGTTNATSAMEMTGEAMPSQINRPDKPNPMTNQTNIQPTNLNFSSQVEHSKSDVALGNQNKPMKTSVTSSDHNLPIKTSVASSNYDLSMKYIVNGSGDQSLPMKPLTPSENNMKTILQGDGSEILKKPADIIKYGNKSTSNVNNCNSLELKMDKYLCSPEKVTMVTKSSKSLSSSIIDDATLSPKSTVRPPGFGGKNDFSVETSSDTIPASGPPMVIPPNSSNFNGCTESVKDFRKTKISPNRANILSGFNKESTIQKPLEVTGSGFTFSKTLSYNLPQSKTNKSATSNVAVEQGKKVPLLQAPEKKPPLLSLPVMEKTRHLSQPNTGRKDIVHGKLSGFDSNSPSPTEAEKKWQFSSGLPNLPPRLQKKRRSFENTKVNHPPVLSEPSWDDEVDDYAEPFVPNFDPRRPLESHIGKQSVDTLEEITLPEKRKTEDVKVDGEKEKQEEDEDWCQVTKKKRKETKPSDVKKPAASRIRHKSAADKTTKSNNFDRLVQMLMEVYTGLTRSQVMDVIQEVRVVRGGLSGLTVKEIMEIARTVIIKKYEHKMTNNQRPMQASDVKGKTSTMTGRRKAELQNIATGHPSNQVTMETVEERANQIKVYNAMKAKQALHTSEKMIDDEDDICVICHDELSYGETKMLDCKHEFHTECISKWVYERERTCPTCRGHALFEDDFPKLGN